MTLVQVWKSFLFLKWRKKKIKKNNQKWDKKEKKVVESRRKNKKIFLNFKKKKYVNAFGVHFLWERNFQLFTVGLSNRTPNNLFLKVFVLLPSWFVYFQFSHGFNALEKSYNRWIFMYIYIYSNNNIYIYN